MCSMVGNYADTRVALLLARRQRRAGREHRPSCLCSPRATRLTIIRQCGRAVASQLPSCYYTDWCCCWPYARQCGWDLFWVSSRHVNLRRLIDELMKCHLLACSGLDWPLDAGTHSHTEGLLERHILSLLLLLLLTTFLYFCFPPFLPILLLLLLTYHCMIALIPSDILKPTRRLQVDRTVSFFIKRNCCSDKCCCCKRGICILWYCDGCSAVWELTLC